MHKIETPIAGAFVIEPKVFGDDRGYFYESFNRDKFVALGITDDFVQDNHSASQQGVLRGMHFQTAPRQMSKLVRCTRGRLFDVVADMRRDSPSFGKWYGVELDAIDKRMLYVPAGCAHGFYALTDCELLYKCGHSTFSPEHDAGFTWDDPDFAIDWPLSGPPTLSARDQAQPRFAELTAT
ncbi:MAG: dTDP-4-dehydrorhamnose 3,5-epimerase [Myxococcales bacterium FL481]|nr:MAG: dTDP-4-dehydrorhamnose 3,5-epimerase [Myxococcales bacterium FL481]